MSRIWTVFKKEVIDNLRDKRALSSSLLTPLFTPLLLIALIAVLGRTVMADPAEKPLLLPVSGAEYAPGLIDYLNQNNVEIIPAPADPETAVRNADVDVVLVIDPTYAEEMQAGRSAPVRLVVDSSRQSSLPALQRSQSLLQTYNGILGTLRLQARGVNPQMLSVIAIERRDVATPQSQALIFLSMMPYLIILTVFVGAMYVIIDTTAGERERGSLEPLLINPIRRSELALGKLLAAIPFAIVTLSLTLIFFYVGFNVLPLEDFIGFPLTVSGAALWNIFLLCLPMVFFGSAVMLLIGNFTRSFKEAQTYLSLVPLVAGLPGMFLGFLSVKATPALMFIPTFGQSILINQLMRAEAVAPLHVWITTLSTLAVTVVVVIAAIQVYQREQVLAGR